MHKHNEVFSIEYNELSFKNLVYLFCRGAEIVFVTKQGKLSGGITNGDVHRSIVSNSVAGYKVSDGGQRIAGGGSQTLIKDERKQLMKMVNPSISHLVFMGDEQLESMAKEIFENSRKIHNIPIVDKEGYLIGQIDRDIRRDSYFEFLMSAGQENAIKYFIQAYPNKKIALTGSRHTFLQNCKEQMISLFQEAGFENIEIFIIDDVNQCRFLNDDFLIISLCDLGVTFLRSIPTIYSCVLSIREIPLFKAFAEMDKVTASVIRNVKDLFGYSRIIFGSSNKYIDSLVELMNRSGISACVISEYEGDEKFLSLENTGVVAISGLIQEQDTDIGHDIRMNCKAWHQNCNKEEQYREYFNISKMMNIFVMLYNFQIAAQGDLFQNVYIDTAVEYFGSMAKSGYKYFYCTVQNLLDAKVNESIEKNGKIELVYGQRKCQKISREIIVDVRVSCRERKSFAIDIFTSVIETLLYRMIRVLFEKMYSTIYFLQRILVPNQKYFGSRYEYLHSSEKFSEDFVKNIYGDNDYPVKELLQDIGGCSVVEINEGYRKYQSNYYSRFFNTDIYGNRIVTDSPSEYIGTIWLAGTCMLSGYAVEDSQTMSSFLQKRLLDEGYLYRVVNLSTDSGQLHTIYQKVLEQDVRDLDILIVQISDNILLSENEFQGIFLDYREVGKQLSDKIWYWDRCVHCSPEANQLLADSLFENIRNDLKRDVWKKKFHLEKYLEERVQNFIYTLKNTIYQNEVYQSVYHTADAGNVKSGSIVMNCNPFTFGHQYLIETASRLADIIYIFVVEEDKAEFPFAQRFAMVQEGVAAFKNVIVVPSGDFMISTLTFPGYFLKANPTSTCYDTFLDLKIFAHYVAPALDIKWRIVGTEPFDKVTARYNHDMKIILKETGIDVIEIPRKLYKGKVISASFVRKLLVEKKYSELKEYVPETTMKYLKSNDQ